MVNPSISIGKCFHSYVTICRRVGGIIRTYPKNRQQFRFHTRLRVCRGSVWLRFGGLESAWRLRQDDGVTLDSSGRDPRVGQ